MAINISVNDPEWDAKILSQFVIQMMYKQLEVKQGKGCISALKVFRALRFNGIGDQEGYSRLVANYLKQQGYVELCGKDDEIKFTDKGLNYFKSMIKISWIF